MGNVYGVVIYILTFLLIIIIMWTEMMCITIRVMISILSYIPPNIILKRTISMSAMVNNEYNYQ